MGALDDRLVQRLQALRDADLHRVRRVVEGRHGVHLRVDGRPCLNFCSNDYLGLAADPRVAEAARRALADNGTGSGASALISGYNREHRRLEEALAEFTGRERVLLFTSGWAANCGVLKGLLGRQDLLLADELNHASLIDGGRLSGARYLRVPHADADAFAAALEAHPSAAGSLRLLVTDSVFSMDGDLAPLPRLADLAAHHDAALMVDDAHGFGVLGAAGRGAVEHARQANPDALCREPDVYVATLGKALGAAGAFVAGSTELIDFLVQRARSWVFSTAPPPAIAAAARAALHLVRDEPEHRLRLQDNIAHFVKGARQRGIPIGLPGRAGVAHPAPCTPILPLLLGQAGRAMAVSRALYARGYWVAGIRPPTVPTGTARLRITLSAAHRREHIEGLLDALSEVLAPTDAVSIRSQPAWA